MSMHLEFEPHSWYRGAAIEKTAHKSGWFWTAYIEDGMRTYSIIEVTASTLKELKQKITKYRSK